MRFSFITLGFLFFISCESDDSVSEPNLVFNVTVTEVEYSHAVLKWNHPNSETDWLYRVVVDNQILVDGLSGTGFTINNLEESTDFSGSVFAIGANDSDTFDEFSFTTRAFDYCLDQNIVRIDYQYQIDNFNCTEVDALIINQYPYDPITDLSGLSILEKANSISI